MKYEIMLILKPLLPEDIRTALQKKIEKLLVGKEGKILELDVWGKRHLAYPINKHDEGYYLIYQFKTEPSNLEEIQNKLNLMNDVLRFIVTNEE